MSTNRNIRWKKESSDFWEKAEDNSVELNAVISYSCQTQTGEGFEELVNTINSDPVRKKVKSVNIVDTSYLYRHTIPEFSAYSDLNIPTKWYTANENSINKLEVSHTLEHWKTGLEDPEFKNWLSKMWIDFAGDEQGNGVVPDFRQIVLSEAEKAAIKGNGIFGQNIRFILEECAYTCLHFQNIVMAYPSQLSPPIANAIKRYGTNVTHLPYSMSNNAQRHRHRSLDRNEVNYEIINFITNIATNINFFVINKNGDIIYKNESLRKIVSEVNASALNPEVWENSQRVMETQESAVVEETDKGRCFLSVKSPLIINNEVEGVIGLSIETTDAKQLEVEKKKSEQLEFLNKIQQVKIDFQTEFTRFISQMAHDITSPLLSLEVFAQTCENLSSDQQHMLTGITASIQNIADDLLQRYKYNRRGLVSSKELCILVTVALSEVIVQKQLQYRKRPDVEIRLSYDPSIKFSFIKVGYSSFVRMISNLINNAVESCNGRKNIIDVKFRTANNEAIIDITDNGDGMSPEMIDKIKSNEPLESNKKEGCGLGLKQAMETVHLYHGRLDANSEKGKGTTLSVAFPLSEQPKWISAHIELQKNDTVVVFDHDISNHNAWKRLLKDYSNELTLKFFREQNEVVNFLDKLPDSDKKKVFLCIGYDVSADSKSVFDSISLLLKLGFVRQCMVIAGAYLGEQLQTLVTSHGIKILPKQFLNDTEVIIGN